MKQHILGTLKFHLNKSVPLGHRAFTSKPSPTLALPPPIKYISRTTPQLIQAQAKEFLYPLCLSGWFIDDTQIRDNDEARITRTSYLAAKFVLRNNQCARKAVQAIIALEEQEKHDICYEVFLKAKPVLTVRTQTHSARKWPPGLSNETSPNITLRDLRFAVLLQKSLEEHNYVLDQALRDEIVPNIQVQWDSILSRFPLSDNYTPPPDTQDQRATS